MDTIQKEWQKNKKAIIISLIAALVLGMAAHAFVYFNPAFAHDALGISQYRDDEWKISIGRFAQPFWRVLRGSVVATWLIGLFAMVATALSSFLLCKIFAVRSTFSLVAVNAILTCNASVVYTFYSFSHEGDMFALSCLCAVLAMWLAPQKRYGLGLGAICLAIGMGFYQAYLGVAVGIALLTVILDLLQKQPYAAIVKRQVRYFITIGAGCVFYFICNKLVQLVSGVAPADSYNSISQLFTGNARRLVASIQGAYEQFVRVVFHNPGLYGETAFRFYLKQTFFLVSIGLFFITALALLVVWVVKNKVPLRNVVLCVVAIALFPLGANCVMVVSGLSLLHMALASCLILILVFWLLEQLGGEGISPKVAVMRCIACVGFSLMMVSSIVFANGMYTIKYLQEKQTFSMMTRIADRMEQTEGFTVSQTPIYFSGLLSQNTQFETNDFMMNEYETTADRKYAVTYQLTNYDFLQYYLHYPRILPTDAQIEAIENSQQLKEMGEFPAKDSVQIIQDVMVVKLS